MDTMTNRNAYTDEERTIANAIEGWNYARRGLAKLDDATVAAVETAATDAAVKHGDSAEYVDGQCADYVAAFLATSRLRPSVLRAIAALACLDRAASLASCRRIKAATGGGPGYDSLAGWIARVEAVRAAERAVIR